MNFANMLELHAGYGYPIALLVMLVTGVGLGLYFKSKKWF